MILEVLPISIYRCLFIHMYRINMRFRIHLVTKVIIHINYHAFSYRVVASTHASSKHAWLSSTVASDKRSATALRMTSALITFLSIVLKCNIYITHWISPYGTETWNFRLWMWKGHLAICSSSNVNVIFAFALCLRKSREMVTSKLEELFEDLMLKTRGYLMARKASWVRNNEHDVQKSLSVSTSCKIVSDDRDQCKIDIGHS